MEYSRLKIKSAPAVEPVSLSDMRLYLKSQTGVTTEDDLITAMITTGREMAEAYTKRAFVTQTWYMYLNHIPAIIELPLGELQSIDEILIYADDGTSTAQSSGIYQVETGNNPIVFLESGNAWTSTTRPRGQMRIEFTSGYGDASTDLPSSAITGVKQIVAHLYENREATIEDIPLAKKTLNSIRILKI